jgi:4-diphosphocytidyl-2-C-methyl-D-erythritol kinase
MSGSGATCFALYESEDAREAASSRLNADWWRMAGKLR